MCNRSSATVLVVEDETFIRMIAADVLEETGCRVIEAATADEALSELAAHREVTVLFTDVNMPGDMDGLTLAATVHAARPDVRIIVTTGRRWLAADELPAGCRFLPKPYRPDELKALVGE